MADWLDSFSQGNIAGGTGQLMNRLAGYADIQKLGTTGYLRNQQLIAAEQAQQQAAQQQAQVQQYVGQTIAKNGGKLTPEVLQTVAQVDPNMYMQLLKEYNVQQEQEQMMQMLSSQDPNSIAAVGAMQRNPAMVSYAQGMRPSYQYNPDTMSYIDTKNPYGSAPVGQPPSPNAPTPVNITDNGVVNPDNPLNNVSPKTRQEMIKDAASKGMTYDASGNLIPLKGSDVAKQRATTLDDMKATVRQVDELISHKGFEGSVGAKGLAMGFGLRDEPVSGSDEAGFMSRLDQLKGKQFLTAYEALKGGGTITEVEGAKAEKAMARMNVASSESEFKIAAKEFQDAVKSGYEKLAGKPLEGKSSSKLDRLNELKAKAKALGLE